MNKKIKKSINKEVKTSSCVEVIRNIYRRRFSRIVLGRKGEGDYSGFTLIEVVIYIAIFSMIAVTLVSLAYVSAREDRETINNVIQAYENE